MGSKTLVFLGLFVAMVLLISSEVAARELAETTNAVNTAEVSEAAEVGDQHGHGHYGGGHGHGHGHYGGGHGHGHGCHHGCCGHGYGRCRCCKYAGEAVDPDFVEAETHN